MLLVAPACEELVSGGKEDARPSGDRSGDRTASDADIRRAAGGGTVMETGAAEETTQDPRSDDPTDAPQTVATRVVEATFVHRATGDNSRGDYTYLTDPSIDGKPNATVFVSPTAGTDDSFDRNIGVWFEPEARQWAIFNQDRAPMPEGTAFDVVVPPEDETFVHRSTPENASAGGTYLDDPLLNGKQDAEPSVTQNWNPGGGRGVYNDHPVGVRYDEDRGRWEVFNKDGAAIPDGTSFNVTAAEVAKTTDGDVVNVDTGEVPEYKNFFSEGNPKTPKVLASGTTSAGAIPVVQPFNFGRDPGGPEDKTLYVSIPKIGVEGVPVFDTVSEDKLRDGTVHIPATGYPWQKGANVFIAGHRLGYEGTPSYYVFFRLDELRDGDEILLEDSAGKEYLYRVTKRKVVGPDSVEVMNAVEGKSLVTLQTCTLPDYEKRLIVQGELVEKGA